MLVSKERMTTREQAVSAMAYLVLNEEEICNEVVSSEIVSFLCTLDNDLRLDEQCDLIMFKDHLSTELIEGNYFKKENFKEKFLNNIDGVVSMELHDFLLRIINESEEMMNTLENVEETN